MRTPWSRILALAASCGVVLALPLAGPGLAQVPPNDACVNAIPMVDGPNGPFTNANATNDPADPPFACSDGGTDIWYTYTASCSGTLVFSMCAAYGGTWDYDAMLNIYTGTCGALTSVGCSDDYCAAAATGSQVSVYCVQAGQTFLIRVGGYGLGVGDVGNFTLAIQCSVPPAPPANDDCAGALPIVDGPNPGLSSDGATTNPGDPPFSCALGGADVWYSYTAGCTGAATFSMCGSTTSPHDALLSVYSGTCGGLTLLGCNNDACGPTGTDPQVSIATTAGTTYLVRVGGAGTCALTGPFAIDVNCSAPPANDNCAAPVALSNGLNGPFDNTAATSSATSASCNAAGSPGFRDLWYSYVATCSGAVTVASCDTLGGTTTLTDTLVTVYDACGGNELACADNNCSTTLSSASFSATAGTTYLVRVAGVGATAQGTFSLTVGCLPDLGAPDDFGDAPGGFVARHTGPLAERLGATVTAEAATRTPAWFGDAGDDGIVSSSNLFPGSATAQIVVSAVSPTSTQTDFVRLWVRRSSTDLGWSGFNDVLPSQSASVGAVPVNFTFGPFTYSASGGPSPAVRARLSRNAAGVGSILAVASFGECEDHLLAGSGGANVAPAAPSPGADAGDAPIPYPPAATRNVLNERLGSAVDGDANAPVGFPTAGDAAWNDEGADDDGIVRLDGLRPGANATLLVRGTNPAGSTLDVVRAWFDFNNDGDWDDAGESTATEIAPIGVGPTGTLFTLGPLAVPAGAPARVATRVKLSRTGSLEGGQHAAGASGNFGEVEDYLLTLQQGTSCNSGGGAAPSAWADDPPRIGLPFTWRIAGLAPGGVVLFVMSPFTLPGIDFALLGLPIPPGACFLYVPPDILGTAGVADPSGNLSTTLAVPNSPALIGGVVNLQNVQLAFPILVTNYLALTVLPG
ncbi:MAG: GEVED domain-containing protein [Planctomycetes bacterium]|nr:GEVED domain-containing protein [Planctomycetota bacterium]